ncbi:MAG: SAM-dependent methyltransferase, partial [Prevotella sp.]|nr:SAM-dependent methyltransferase [Prevotella sp.]
MNTEEFIRKHREQDVRDLAFVASRYPEVDTAFALDQIRGWQVAVRKLPSWACTDGLLYPPHLSMEQCSSEHTAAYKSALAARLLSEGTRTDQESVFVDLTGGFGVDFSFMASSLGMRSVYVERNRQLCDLATHNLPLLGLPEAEVVCADSVAYASSMPFASVVYLDPARRDSHGSRTYGIEDCTPNLLELLPLLMSKSEV